MSEDMERLRDAAGGAEAVLVTERGAAWSSVELGRFLGSRLVHANSDTLFLVGGADGFLPTEERWAAHRLKLSDLTLPHELVRLVLAEQVYRGLTMVRNIRYHK